MAELNFRHPLTETDTLIFLHIPKTGGVTLDEILANQFPWDDIHPAPTPLNVVTTPKEGSFPAQYANNLVKAHQGFNPINQATGKKYRLIIGHWDFSLVDKFPPMLPITFLRDPISRLVSHYHQVRRQDDRWNTRYHDFQNMNLLDWARDAGVQKDYANVQTRYMAGTMWNESQLSNQELLVRAKENLQKSAFVGIQERFDDSLLLLSYTFGWKPITQYKTHNVTPSAFIGAPLTPDECNALMRLSELDLELYEYGKQIYNVRLSAMINQFFQSSFEPSLSQRHSNQKTHAKRIFNADLRQQIEERIDAVAMSLPSTSELDTHTDHHDVSYALPAFDEQAFIQKFKEFERAYVPGDFEKLAKRLGDRFEATIKPDFDTVMEEYPHYRQLLIDHPALIPTVERYLPALKPFTQGPYPLPGHQVIHGPWLGSYKTYNFPLCDVTEETVRGQRILDVGCNAGFDCFYYASLGALEVIGIDHDPFIFQAMFLRTLYHCPGLKFIRTSWQNLYTYSVGTFDIVNCQGVLYHEPSPISLIRGLFNLIRPGGKLVLETHITLENDMNAMFVEGSFQGDDTYWWVPSIPVAEAMLRACGFIEVQLRNQIRVSSANPHDPDRTVEGLPAGGRAFITAIRPLSGEVHKP